MPRDAFCIGIRETKASPFKRPIIHENARSRADLWPIITANNARDFAKGCD